MSKALAAVPLFTVAPGADTKAARKIARQVERLCRDMATMFMFQTMEEAGQL